MAGDPKTFVMSFYHDFLHIFCSRRSFSRPRDFATMEKSQVNEVDKPD